jgi:hypothetical protein
MWRASQASTPSFRTASISAGNAENWARNRNRAARAFSAKSLALVAPLGDGVGDGPAICGGGLAGFTELSPPPHALKTVTEAIAVDARIDVTTDAAFGDPQDVSPNAQSESSESLRGASLSISDPLFANVSGEGNSEKDNLNYRRWLFR